MEEKSSGATEHRDAMAGPGIPWAAVTEAW